MPRNEQWPVGKSRKAVALPESNTLPLDKEAPFLKIMATQNKKTVPLAQTRGQAYPVSCDTPRAALLHCMSPLHAARLPLGPPFGKSDLVR